MALTLKYDAPTTQVDLTDASVNAKACPIATPRVGGFTLRNRFSGALATTLTASCVSTSDVDVNLITVLDIPKRTLVKDLHLFGVESQAVPNHAFTYAGTSTSLSANDINADLAFLALPYKSPSQASTIAVSASLVHGVIETIEATNSLIAGGIVGSVLEKVDASMTDPEKGHMEIAHTMTSNAVAAGSLRPKLYYPHGGKIILALKGAVADSATKVNQMAGACSGVWEIQANCNYVPE
jgi:hypothetical protein